MTSDKARKKEIRARMERTGEPYAEAARHVGRDPEAAREITRPEHLDDVPGAVLPAPVAVMMARHLNAAGMHLGAAKRLAADNGAPGYRDLGREDGPMDTAHSRAFGWVYHLGQFAERTTVASSAAEAVPAPWGDATPAQKRAYEALYPNRGSGWCTREGGALPQPGQDGQDTADDSPSEQGRRVRHLLPSPVPSTRLTYTAHGRNLVKAGDVVPGTPAAPIWDAHRTLNTYACEWMDRAGDTPADLAAALEGCREVLDEVQGVAAGVLDEIDRRARRGTLTGADTEALDTARAALDREKAWPLLQALTDARAALDGAAAELPNPAGVRVPDRTARQMTGRTAAQIRHEHGLEVFTNRHIGKVTAPNERRADALARILDWMHATGQATYDPAEHATNDPGRAEG
ncbi:hypothetical protein [Actinomadura sp. 3N407]|uniref:hypothetical protein n=1 Tax=Actinomadura sp. 3N407 TaxID=3457423 RepID=UPI003FCED002